MIQSLGKRIIFCGNYRVFPPKWRFINDESNNDMSFGEFAGYDNFNYNYAVHLDKDAKAATNRMKLNRIIDSSEYVIRLNHGKMSNPSFNLHGSNPNEVGPSSVYGGKTDILGLRELNYGGDVPGRQWKAEHWGTTDDHIIAINIYNDLTVKLGIKTIISDKYNWRWDESNEDHNESMYREVGNYYSSMMIGSEMDEIKQKEIWLCMSEIYIDTDNEGYMHPSSREHIANMLPIFKETIKKVEIKYGININFLSEEDYHNFYGEMYETHINYKDLKDLIGHKKWAIDHMYTIHPEADKNGWCKSELEWEEWMTCCINNGYLSPGAEMIAILINDKRFDDYDKYIIGVGGLNEMFNVTSTFNWSAWEEQFIISKYIKSGKLKWLPEHIDSLHANYQKNISETGINLCSEETFYMKSQERKSRIKLYDGK
tara:strand:+ start:1647 stop:2930 length:1284 start_codon:yes stop_codon:yes gene_type:complete